LTQLVNPVDIITWAVCIRGAKLSSVNRCHSRRKETPFSKTFWFLLVWVCI